MLKNLPLDRKFLLRSLILFVSFAFACKFSQGSAFAFTLPIALWAIMNKRLEWMFLMLLMMSTFMGMNSWVVPKSMLFVNVQRAEMMLIGLMMLFMMGGQGVARMTKPVVGIFIYIAYMFIPSASGFSPIISYLKLALFIVVFAGYLGMTNMIVQDRRENIYRIRSVMLCYMLFIFVGSVLLYPFPAISQLNRMDMTDAEIAQVLANGGVSLFKGMTQHSQVLGPLAALSMVLLVGDYLFSIGKNSWLYNIIFACGLFSLYKTSSRTGMASMIAGLLLVVYFFVKARGVAGKWKMRVMTMVTTIGILFCIGSVSIPSIRSSVYKYLLKGAANEDTLTSVTADDVLQSRQGKWDEGIYYWKKSPVIGNGFQVNFETKALYGNKGLKSMLSAPVEKSIWVSAVLEEGGVIGFGIFCCWLLLVVFGLLKCHAYIGLSVFATFIITNLGEFTLFSLSYTGATQWCMVFAGIIMDSQRYKFNARIKTLAEARVAAAQEEFEMTDLWVEGKGGTRE